MVIRLLEEYRRYLPGAQIEVSAAEAKRLVEDGRAVPVRDSELAAVESRDDSFARLAAFGRSTAATRTLGGSA